MKIKMIAFDMDYTMLRTGGIVSEKTTSVLREAQRRGIVLVPTTGRDLTEMEDLKDKLMASYYVTVNGALITDAKDEKVLFKAVPPKEAFLEKLKCALDMGIFTEAYCGGCYTDAYSYENMEKLGIPKDQMHLFTTTRKVVPDLYEFCRQGEPEKLHIVFQNPEDKENRQAPFLGHPDFSYTAAFPHNLELSKKGIDKAGGLAALAEILGIKREEIMALGDGGNDVCMIKWAGLGVAMANAVPEAKAVADYVTLTNDEDGAALAIEKFCF